VRFQNEVHANLFSSAHEGNRDQLLKGSCLPYLLTYLRPCFDSEQSEGKKHRGELDDVSSFKAVLDVCWVVKRAFGDKA